MTMKKGSSTKVKKQARGVSITRQNTPKMKRKFCELYAKRGNIVGVCESLNLSTSTVYKWKKTDPDFLLQFEAASDDYLNILEAEADRRAVHGIEEPVYQGGELVGYKQKYSDVLLMFRAKALNPRKYRDNYSLEHTGKDGNAIEVDQHITIGGKKISF